MSIPNPHYIVASMKLGPSKKPKYHQTEEDALAEAERLAILHQDDSFQVYKSHRFVKARTVDVYDNSGAKTAPGCKVCGTFCGMNEYCASCDEDDDYIPF